MKTSLREVSAHLAGIAVFLAAQNLNAQPLAWTARVIDARTGAAVPGIECYGGGSGRVDLTSKVTTDAEGRVTVVYDAPLDLDFWHFYAFDATDPQDRYFHYRRSQVSPQPLLVRLVPKRAFIQGVVRDALSLEPLAGVHVELGRPGQVRQSTDTGPDGRFSFEDAAYNGAKNSETIPEGERAEGGANDSATPVTDYWVRASLAGYRSLDTADRGLTLPLLSSVTDAIHTQVELALAPEAASADADQATAQVVTPPVWRIKSSSVLNGEIGHALTYQIVADNEPTSFSATGLPEGLVLEPTTGLISGSPTVPGVSTVSLEAIGDAGSASASLLVVISATEVVVFDNNNIWGVSSGPPQPTTFTLTVPTRIDYVTDYHYFNGGVLPGTIAFRREDGTLYGPWQTAGRIGQGNVQNASWDAWPMTVLPAGNYTVEDSHPPTWSYNGQSGDRGICTIRGTPEASSTPSLLAAWTAAHGLDGEAAGPEADPDGDGQPNWVELAVGGNPALADPPLTPLLGNEGGNAALRVPVCAGGIGVPGADFVINGARVQVRVTGDLAPSSAWTSPGTLLDLFNAQRQSRNDGREDLVLPFLPARAAEGPWFIQVQLHRVTTP